MKNKEYLTAAEVAEEFYGNSIAACTVRRYAREKKLPVIQVGTGARMVFKRSDIEAYIKSSIYKIPAPTKKVTQHA